MAMHSNTGGADDEVIASINTTPLVDVMLVLLIIFLITIPVVTHTVPVSLPKERNIPLQTKPENINIAVRSDGSTYWNQQPVANIDELKNRLREIATKTPQPVIQIRGDGAARYKDIGRIIFACQSVGLLQVGFITQPPARGG
jgi:biopolymer transport protein ExbD